MATKLYSLVVLLPFVLNYGVVLSSNVPYKFNDLLVFMARSTNNINYQDMQVLLQKLHFENCSQTRRSNECNRVSNDN